MFAELRSRLPNLSLDALIALYYQPEAFEVPVYYLEEVAFEIRERGAAGKEFLFERQQTPATTEDEDRLRAVIIALSFRPSRKEGIKTFSPVEKTIFLKKLKGCLSDSRWRIVMQALIGLRHAKQKGAYKQALALRHHPAVLLRESAIEYLANVYPAKAFEPLKEALNDESYLVRQTAVDELGLLGNLEALPLLRNLLNDPEADVRESTQRAIENLLFDAEIDEILNNSEDK